MTIRDLIQIKINNNKYVIPAIQRKYVWKENKICKYFDSIMRGYPTGYIMLWNIKADYINSKQITFYKFLDEFEENKQEYNKPIGNVAPGDDYCAVLDGQQRIQSLIIALNGKYITKSGVKKELYINLLEKKNVDNGIDICEDDDSYQSNYEFSFLEESKAENNKNGIWFKVKDILNINSSKDIRESLAKYKDRLGDSYDYAQDLLILLMDRINNSKDVLKIESISSNFTDINEILEIFIRANSSGEPLTKSDLLFSTVVLNWDKGRDIIDDFLKRINTNGPKDSKFRFNNDFIMRTFLFIQGEDTTMKIEYFDNIAKGIEKSWPKIKLAIEKVVRNIKNMGFSGNLIHAYNSIIPLVYYAYNGGSFNFTDLEEMRKYIIVSHLKRIFGNASNQTLKTCKEILKDKKDFKLSYFYDASFNGRVMKVSADDIESWMNFEKDKDQLESTLVLSLLYPKIDFGKNIFHKDHAHPKKLIEDLNNSEYLKYYNKIPNLELLTGQENEKKKITPLEDWNILHKDIYIKKNMPLDINQFLKFYELRKNLMVKKLKKVFGLK